MELSEWEQVPIEPLVPLLAIDTSCLRTALATSLRRATVYIGPIVIQGQLIFTAIHLSWLGSLLVCDLRVGASPLLGSLIGNVSATVVIGLLSPNRGGSSPVWLHLVFLRSTLIPFEVEILSLFGSGTGNPWQCTRVCGQHRQGRLALEVVVRTPRHCHCE